MSDKLGSIWKVEFSEPEDMKYAMLNLNYDLKVYIIHMRDLAQRMEKHFPEIAQGLLGTADGIAQYLRGLDGDWRTTANVGLKATLSAHNHGTHMWAYEFCRDPNMALLLFGICAAVASAKPQLNFWEVLDQARTKLSKATIVAPAPGEPS